MSRVLLILLALGLMTPLALAQDDEEDPFADANETAEEEEDPFSTYEQRRNETFAAQQNDTNETDLDGDAADANTTATPTATATATATAAGGDDASADTPGFGLAALVGALGVALLVLRRRG